MKRFVILFLTVPVIGFSQTFVNLDINPNGDVDVMEYGETSARTIFRVSSSTSGFDGIWATDGTKANTEMISSAAPSNSFAQYEFTTFNGEAFFSAQPMLDDDVSGVEIWKTDGTTAGTVMLKDINPGDASSLPEGFTEFNNELYFRADDGTHGGELWKTDGTEAGTQMVKDINTGAGNSNPTQLIVSGGVLYFTAFTVEEGGEIWKSDGTSAGTLPIGNIVSGPGSANPSDLSPLGNGTFAFVADDGMGAGREPWISDGTSDGTTLLKDIEPGTETSFPSDLTPIDGFFYFTAIESNSGGELWVSDGTSAGTRMVDDINPGAGSSFPTNIFNPSGNEIYFRADNGTDGVEPFYKADSSSSAVQLGDLSANADGSFPGQARAAVGGNYFTASTGSTSSSLFQSNGTPAATVAIGPSNATNSDPFPTNPETHAGSLGTIFYFNANYDATGKELWTLTTNPQSITEDDFEDMLISIFPNPTDGIFEIRGDFKNPQVEIFDIWGRKVLETTSMKIDLSRNKNDVYVLQVTEGDRIRTQKIVLR